MNFSSGFKKLSIDKSCQKSHTAREMAVKALGNILFSAVDAQQALDVVLKGNGVNISEKALCTELVYGTLRQKIRIDFFLKGFLKKPGNLPGDFFLALEIAVYELFFLRVPEYATLNETVNFLKHRFGARLAGVGNGVLRSIQRKRESFWQEATYTSDHTRITGAVEETTFIMDSLPAWIGQLWSNAYGEQISSLYRKGSLTAPPTGVRFRSEFQGSKDEAAELSLFLEGAEVSVENRAYSFSKKLSPVIEKALAEGKAVRQSAASSAVLVALDPKSWKTPIWDCCAGRGGKTLALMDLGVSLGLVSDVSRARLNGFISDSIRLGVKNLPPIVVCSAVNDPCEGHFLEGNAHQVPSLFGSIVIDAPCSGLGTLARRPEIRFRRSLDDIKKLSRLQGDILRAAAKRIQPKGNLIYITCTLSPAENEECIAAFLKETPNVKILATYQTEPDSPLREYFYGISMVVE